MPPAAVISLRLPPDLATAIDAHCQAAGVSRTDFMAGLAARELGIPYTLGTERTGWAGADAKTIRKAIAQRTKAPRKPERKPRASLSASPAQARIAKSVPTIAMAADAGRHCFFWVAFKNIEIIEVIPEMASVVQTSVGGVLNSQV